MRDHAIHPVPVLIQRAEHEGEVVHHHGVHALQLVHVLRWLGGLADLGLPRRPASLQAQRLHHRLYAGGLAAAGPASHDDACEQEQNQHQGQGQSKHVAHRSKMAYWGCGMGQGQGQLRVIMLGILSAKTD